MKNNPISPKNNKQASLKQRRSYNKNHKLYKLYNLGLTLIELMVVLTIVAILSSLATPSFKKIFDQTNANATQANLRSAINRARSAAITHKKIITLCPYNNLTCGENWNTGAMIITDANNDRKINDQDIMLEKIDFPDKNLKITWRASAGRNFLRFSPTGMAREFGKFIVCDKKNDPTLSRSLVINRQGRLRQYQDRNDDHIVEDSNGRIADC